LAEWRARASFAAALVSRACFLRVLFHFGFAAYGVHLLNPTWFRRTALLVDGAWLLALVTGLVLARRARHLRQRLGIQLDGAPKGESPRRPDSAG
jgi:hypothetical protein